MHVVTVETEGLRCRALPLYELPASAVFEALGTESGPMQMKRTADLFELAILDGAHVALADLSYAQYGVLLSDWMAKSSDPDLAEELDFDVDSEDVGESEGDPRNDGSGPMDADAGRPE
jgi:hypothetical protein